MDHAKHILTHGLLALGLALLAALPARGTDLAELERLFATCTGRLTAQLEHEQIWGTEDAARISEQRGQMLDLLNAVSDPARATTRLNLRLEARLAHARLLRSSRDGAHPDQAAWARARAAQMVAECAALLIPGDGGADTS